MKPYVITSPLCTDDLVVMSLMSLEKNLETLCKLDDISQQRLNELMDYANRLAAFVERRELQAIDYFPDVGKAWR